MRPDSARPGLRVWLKTRAELVELASAEFRLVLYQIFTLVLLSRVLNSGFSLCVQMSAVRFGELGEVPSLLVVSDRRTYFLEMTSENQ